MKPLKNKISGLTFILDALKNLQLSVGLNRCSRGIEPRFLKEGRGLWAIKTFYIKNVKSLAS